MLLMACHRYSTERTFHSGFPAPHVIVYKTKGNYNLLVPVLLAKNKKQLISYPDVSDIRNLPELPLPDTLLDGYLLDKRGIDASVAFLDITYHDYAKLRETPEPDKLLMMVTDNDPLTEMYDCGPWKSGTDRKSFANELIRKGYLGHQKRLK